MYNFGVQIQLFVNRYNHLARKWPQVNPCSLYSAMMEDCIQNEMDVTEGGARYNSDSFGMTGLGTVVDSLSVSYTHLLQNLPRVGYQVTPISPREIHEI